jgi:hypothetical protein
MTADERVEGLIRCGFTPRQAGFLDLVMIHAGVGVQRQYSTFCGIKFGHNTRDFFERLTASRYATAYPWGRRHRSLPSRSENSFGRHSG